MIGDRTAAQRVSAVEGRQVVVDYLPWLGLDRNHLNADDVTTGDIRVVNLNFAGSIQAREGATTTVEPLVMSSELSMAINTDQIRTMPDPAKLIAQFTPSGKPFVPRRGSSARSRARTRTALRPA